VGYNPREGLRDRCPPLKKRMKVPSHVPNKERAKRVLLEDLFE
jgi:hypothetical protein